MLAIQDTLNQFGWPVLEMSTSLIVAQAKGEAVIGYNMQFSKVSAKLSEKNGETAIAVSVSFVGPMLGYKTSLTGIMGKFTNSLSLRIQTESIAINPTVALGEGQGTSPAAASGPSPVRDRAQQLKDLKELLDDGVLSAEEFAEEKRRILSTT